MVMVGHYCLLNKTLHMQPLLARLTFPDAQKLWVMEGALKRLSPRKRHQPPKDMSRCPYVCATFDEKTRHHTGDERVLEIFQNVIDVEESDERFAILPHRLSVPKRVARAENRLLPSSEPFTLLTAIGRQGFWPYTSYRFPKNSC